MKGRLAYFIKCLGVASLLTGCAVPPVLRDFADAEEPEVAAAVDREAVPGAFAVCRGYGCGHRDLVGLDAGELGTLRALFQPPPPDAAAERAAVAMAVGYLEDVTGRALGTWADKPRTPMSLGDPSQLDCVDESINTSTVLHLLRHEGLLRWHVPVHPARRYAFLGFGVHFTAVLVEQPSGRAFAVDSWFHANGRPAEVLPLAQWRRGWEPKPGGSGPSR